MSSELFTCTMCELSLKPQCAPKIQEILKNDIFKRLVVDAAKMLWEIDQKAVVFILLLLPPEVLLFDGV